MEEPIEAINGGTMPAITVFSKALKYLGDKITKFIKDTKVVENQKEMTWVITVPAIWQPGARHFMRKAAYAVRLFIRHILLQSLAHYKEYGEYFRKACGYYDTYQSCCIIYVQV